MRISHRKIEKGYYLVFLIETHGLFCKIYASPEQGECEKTCECNCKYGHINNDKEIKQLIRKMRRG